MMLAITHRKKGQYMTHHKNGTTQRVGIMSSLALALATLLSGTDVRADQVIQVDPNLKGYLKVTGVSGNLNSIGSDTLNNLMTLWAEDSVSNTRTSKSKSKARAPARHLPP